MNYYNENDKKTAAWIRELVAARLVPRGDVDERSIVDVQPSDLKGYTQCHFFAGICGWSLALQLAGWPSDKPVWTGSCPCQPFSSAGKGLGDKDERHLWPVFASLIRSCKPPVCFGEQVASKAGREWLAGVFADLEGMDYQRAGADLCAASVKAPHIRQRLYWVANSTRPTWERPELRSDERAYRGVNSCRLVQPDSDGREAWSPATTEPRHGDSTFAAGCGTVALGDTIGTGLERHRESGEQHDKAGRQTEERHGSTSGAWDDSIIIGCRDGKQRRIPSEPAFFPLASRIPARVVRLRGYGNAIVPQVAAEFIASYMDIAQ